MADWNRRASSTFKVTRSSLLPPPWSGTWPRICTLSRGSKTSPVFFEVPPGWTYTLATWPHSVNMAALIALALKLYVIRAPGAEHVLHPGGALLPRVQLGCSGADGLFHARPDQLRQQFLPAHVQEGRHFLAGRTLASRQANGDVLPRARRLVLQLTQCQ